MADIKVSDELEKFRQYFRKDNNEDAKRLFDQVSKLTKAVKNEIYRLLVDEFNYFE
jgi:hypothetical protein